MKRNLILLIIGILFFSCEESVVDKSAKFYVKKIFIDNSLYTENFYDDNFYLSEKYIYYKDTVSGVVNYEYNLNGKVSKTITTKSYNDYIEFDYNDKNQLIEKKYYLIKNDSLYRIHRLEYSQEGKLDTYTTLNADGIPSYWRSYEYNGVGKLYKVIFWGYDNEKEDWVAVDETIYTFDDMNNPNRNQDYNFDLNRHKNNIIKTLRISNFTHDTMTQQYTHVYNQDNFPIKTVEFRVEENSTRIIEYEYISNNK